jgi:hypothetical protein
MRGKKMIKLLIRLLSISAIFLLLCMHQPIVLADNNFQNWTQAINLSQSDTQSTSPSTAVDPFGDVHVVWSEEIETGDSYISYSHLADGQWTSANEILSGRWSQSAGDPSLAVDSLGILHLVYLSDANIYYSAADASLASSSQSWSDPIGLEYMQNDIGKPDLIVDQQDNLLLVYPILFGDNSGIYFMVSKDQGMNWSDPITIYQNTRSDRMVHYPRIAVGQDGSLHVAWVEFNFPEIFPPIGIRYANSTNAGANWSNSFSLADGPYSYPAITTRESEVHVVWSGTSPDRFKFHRWSRDNGKYWQPTWRNTELGGYQGLPDLTLDSSNTLHWLTTGTVFQIDNDSIYHTQWENEQWLPGEVMLRNQISIQNPQDVSAEVRLGNELYVAVQYPLASNTQPDGWQYEIFLIHQDLGTPHLEAKPVSTVKPQPTSIVIATEMITVLQTPMAPLNLNYRSSNPLTPILAGIVAALVIVLIFYRIRRKF